MLDKLERKDKRRGAKGDHTLHFSNIIACRTLAVMAACQMQAEPLLHVARVSD